MLTLQRAVCVLAIAAFVLPIARTIGESPRPLVLAHYMPWYAAKPVSDTWGWHWTMNHFDPEKLVDGKRSIASAFYPMIGPYDSSDADVIEYHLLTMKAAGIDGVIVDWYGLQTLYDCPMLHRNTSLLIERANAMGLKFAICYEDQTLPALLKAGRVAESDRVVHVASEIRWLNANWFKLDNHVRIDGKPVMLSFGNAGLTNEEWTKCIGGLDFPIAYFSEHHARIGAVGAFDWPIPGPALSAVDQFNERSSQWQAAIPVAFPRFVDIYGEANVRESYDDIDDNAGETMRSTLSKALSIHPQIIQLATWNDWGEGTVIEPSREFGFRDLTMVQKMTMGTTAKPSNLELPLKLFTQRRDKGLPPDELETISMLLSSGKYDEARLRLEHKP